MIAPFAPGGSTDALARIVGQKLGEQVKQSVVIDNRVGAGGMIGAEVVSQSPPDGYTLLMGGAVHAIGMSLFKVRYDLAKDFTPISMVVTFPSLIVVHPALPVRSVKELVALAKARPGELNFGSGGNGSPNHLSMEVFKSMAKVDMLHIPYKGGSGQLIGDLLAGQVQLASMGLPPSIAYVKAGRLRALAVTGLKRSRFLPDIPTVDASGVPGFDVTTWNGIWGPADLAKNVLSRLNQETVTALRAADVQERLAAIGAEPSPSTPEEFGNHVRREISKWAAVVKSSGAKVD